MNLTDLQSELRAMQKTMALLESEIEKMKPRPADKQAERFRRIDIAARNAPLGGRGLDSASENTLNTYIKVLSYLAQSDTDRFEEKMIYITRIASSANNSDDYTAEHITAMGHGFEAEDIGSVIDDLGACKYTFLTDALVVINAGGTASDTSIDCAAELAGLLGMSPVDTKACALLARALLTDNYKEFLEFDAPLTEEAVKALAGIIPEKALSTQRISCGKYCTGSEKYTWLGASSTCEFKYKIKNGSVVKEGELLLSYIRSNGSRKKVIKAPSAGVVYLINDRVYNRSTGEYEKFLFVYIASRYDSYEKVKEWHKQTNT